MAGLSIRFSGTPLNISDRLCSRHTKLAGRSTIKMGGRRIKERTEACFMVRESPA